MECPYCKCEMKAGCIPATNSYVFWQGPYDRESFSSEKVPLQKYDLLKAEDAPAHYCPDCRVVIVPVPEFEKPGDKIARKWNGFTESIRGARDAYAAERAERTREKRSEKRRKKDPWEVD